MDMRSMARMTSTPKLKSKTHWFCYNSAYYKSHSFGDERDEEEEKKTREFMAKYMANYKAHRKGMSPQDVAEYYSAWAQGNKYEQDLDPGTYNGPTIIADEVAVCYPETRDKVKILDIACGTGRVGEELARLGFKTIDGLDPSEGMLKECRKKNIYKTMYKEFCSDKTLPIDAGVYDCVVVAGGLGEGHIPCSGLLEMIRVVKPGGFVLFVMRKEYLKYVEEYMDRLDPFINRLDREQVIELVERREVTNYSFERDGVLYKLRVKKGILAAGIICVEDWIDEINDKKESQRNGVIS